MNHQKLELLDELLTNLEQEGFDEIVTTISSSGYTHISVFRSKHTPAERDLIFKEFGLAQFHEMKSSMYKGLIYTDYTWNGIIVTDMCGVGTTKADQLRSRQVKNEQ